MQCVDPEVLSRTASTFIQSVEIRPFAQIHQEKTMKKKLLEIAPFDQGRRSGRVSQRWVVQVIRMRCLMVMMVLARAMDASMTRVCFSVQMASFLKPRLCQELERSTTQRAVFWIGAGIPLVAMCPWHPSSSSRSRVTVES